MKERLFHIAAFVLGLAWFSAAAVAQPDNTASFSGGGDIGLRVSQVGIGNRARPGDWAAIQVDVLHRSSNPKPMEVIIRMDIPNDDGDEGMHQRKVVTNPNRPVTTWLYARLPFSFDNSTELQVSAFLPFDQEAGVDTLSDYDPTKPVGTTTQRTVALISENSGLIGIVGRRPAGIERYSERIGTTTDVPLTGHELTELAGALTPASIPDRVHGLRSLEALVWTGSTPEEQPGKLNVAQADAIREWVASGGHLVVVLPLVGQTWLDTPNPLSEIMPKVHPVRREGASLDAMRYLLVTTPRLPLPASSILHAFTPDPAAGPFDAMPIINSKDGEVIVVRRLVGIGAVTLIGLDAPNLASAGALRADAFWNRILGKRLELPTRKEVDDLQSLNQLPGSIGRNDKWFEQSIPSAINWASDAAYGLLAAVVVFGGFWLVAGPVGFFLLKQRNKVQHAWVAYAVAIAAFTAISWSAASVLRQRSSKAYHVTVLDHVYGQPCQRARVWANVFLPSYGKARVSVQKKPFELAGRPLQPSPAIATWDSPGPGGTTEFPETRTYVVDARAPESVELPARSTTRQLQIDWLGSPRWSMPLPQAADGKADPVLGDELKLQVADPQGMPGRWTVTGTLTHDLPAELKDVVIIVNRGQKIIAPVRGGELTCDAGVFVLTEPWKAGTPIDLAEKTKHGNDNSIRAENYLDDITPKGGSYMQSVPGTTDKQELQAAKSEIVRNLVRLSLYSMLAPPSPRTANDNRAAARRQSTHTLDLGRWFTQPCVIIIGFIDGPSPVPIEVDGNEIPTSGKTVVRWVFPLAPAAPGYMDIPATSPTPPTPAGTDAGTDNGSK